MIVGLGLDVVEVARLERLLDGRADPGRAERFLDRCFTTQERAYCDARRDRATRYAARFAAKEAVVKALGAPAGVRWTDIEVSRAEGAPTVRLRGAAERAARGLGVDAVHLTLTHDGGVAAAAVVLESRGGP
ncbi:MAG TPA: holo-ACP synthase [Anaeromyxobacteraceae bacterium]|nr:holo-ACP synthase [Anaeromyxobacteraceae bacterium]